MPERGRHEEADQRCLTVEPRSLPKVYWKPKCACAGKHASLAVRERIGKNGIAREASQAQREFLVKGAERTVSDLDGLQPGAQRTYAFAWGSLKLTRSRRLRTLPAKLRNVSKLTFTSSRRPLRVDPTRAAVASIDRDYGARADQINGDFTGLDSPPSGLQLDFAGTPFLFERPRNWTCFRRRSAHAPGGPVDRVWAQKKADRFSRGSRPARRWQDRSACLAKPSSRPGRRERPLPASSCLHPSASADRARSSACRSCR